VLKLKNRDLSTGKLMMHLKLLEKQEQTKPQNSRWREIIKVRTKINEIQTKQTIQRNNETKSWFFEKTNKIHKPLANVTKPRREKTQMIKSEMKKET
jgi:hypothetical protein